MRTKMILDIVLVMITLEAAIALDSLVSKASVTKNAAVNAQAQQLLIALSVP